MLVVACRAASGKGQEEGQGGPAVDKGVSFVRLR